MNTKPSILMKLSVPLAVIAMTALSHSQTMVVNTQTLGGTAGSYTMTSNAIELGQLPKASQYSVNALRISGLNVAKGDNGKVEGKLNILLNGAVVYSYNVLQAKNGIDVLVGDFMAPLSYSKSDSTLSVKLQWEPKFGTLVNGTVELIGTATIEEPQPTGELFVSAYAPVGANPALGWKITRGNVTTTGGTTSIPTGTTVTPGGTTTTTTTTNPDGTTPGGTTVTNPDGTTTTTPGTTTTTIPGDTSGTVPYAGHNNNGHGNNYDGVDCSNPGKGSGGPTGLHNSGMDPSGTVDDEIRSKFLK